MLKRTGVLVSIVAVPLALLAGYVATTITQEKAVQAHTLPAEMLDRPYILFLAPPDVQRGALNHSVMQNRGVVSVQSWGEARQRTQDRTVDALIIDAALLDVAGSGDLNWLRDEYRNGLVLVGLGVDDDSFARILGLETFRVSGEASVPLGPTGYRLTYGMVLGRPDEINNLGDWITRLRNGQAPSPPVEHPMVMTFRSARGEVNTEEDIDLLFARLNSAIRGIYETRAEFQEALESTEE